MKASRSRSLLGVAVLAFAAWVCPTPSFVPARTAQPWMALGLAQVLVPAPARADINQDAYYAAAGVDPDQIRNQMIDQMSDTDAALLGASDFFWDILVPFSAGAGLVYGIGITTGNLEGPFPQQEDGEQKS